MLPARPHRRFRLIRRRLGVFLIPVSHLGPLTFSRTGVEPGGNNNFKELNFGFKGACCVVSRSFCYGRPECEISFYYASDLNAFSQAIISYHAGEDEWKKGTKRIRLTSHLIAAAEDEDEQVPVPEFAIFFFNVHGKTIF